MREDGTVVGRRVYGARSIDRVGTVAALPVRSTSAPLDAAQRPRRSAVIAADFVSAGESNARFVRVYRVADW